MMEEFKKINQINEPDERQEFFVIINNETGKTRARTLEDIYREAGSIKLSDSVPEDIQSHFATAKNLLVYSWYYYPFNVTAEFLAYVTVEKALKVKFEISNHQSFKSLVRRAVDEGLVLDNGFEHIRYTGDQKQSSDGQEVDEDVRSYVETLIDIMPNLRNTLAHGSNMLHMNGAISVKICADFINQLF